MSFDPLESDYPTCQRCYVNLCIYTGDLEPNYVTKILNIEPSHVTKRGERASVYSDSTNPINGWFLSLKGDVNSRDLRNHLDWLFEKIASSRSNIDRLREGGCRLSVWGYWMSRAGHGGPILSVSQSKKLAELEFEFCLDVGIKMGGSNNGT